MKQDEPHKILGVRPDAGQAEIEAAYERVYNRHEARANAGNPQAIAALEALNYAYDEMSGQDAYNEADEAPDYQPDDWMGARERAILNELDPHRVLGIRKKAGPAEIDSAYSRLYSQYERRARDGDDNAIALLQRLNDAYDEIQGAGTAAPAAQPGTARQGSARQAETSSGKADRAYAILKIEPGVTDEEIEDAYDYLFTRYEKRALRGDEAATVYLERLNRAYDSLLPGRSGSGDDAED